MIRSSEWARMVLPAPVSPVIALSPRPRRSSARSISSRFSIRSSSSIGPVLARTPDGLGGDRLPSRLLGQRLLGRAPDDQVTFAGEQEAERGAGEGDDRPDQQDLVEGADERFPSG